MSFQIQTSLIYILVIGTVLLIIFLKISKKRINKTKPREIELISQIQHKEAKLELNEISKRLKEFIESHYKINKNLSMSEIVKELKIQKEKHLILVCKKIERYYYTNREISEREVANIKEEVIKVISELTRKKERKTKLEKQNQPLLTRLITKEQEIKEKIRIQKMTRSRLKNKNSKVNK